MFEATSNIEADNLIESPGGTYGNQTSGEESKGSQVRHCTLKPRNHERCHIPNSHAREIAMKTSLLYFVKLSAPRSRGLQLLGGVGVSMRGRRESKDRDGMATSWEHDHDYELHALADKLRLYL